MIRVTDDLVFVLDTDNTTYAFRILPTGHPEHLYYGSRIHIDSADGLAEHHEFAPGNTCLPDEGPEVKYSLEDMRLEMSTLGKGDLREPFMELVNSDGSRTSDMRYGDYKISKGKEDNGELPGSYGPDADVLEVMFSDKENNTALSLKYTVYEECNVITRSCTLTNLGEDDITIERLMSLQIDMDKGDYKFTTFTGAWGAEMKRTDIKVEGARIVSCSNTGSSSNKANPFVMISKGAVDEDYGRVYGFNLIYSGNHYESIEKSSFGKPRFLSGINPQGFTWKLAKGESFDSPEAVMTFSCSGYNGQSRNMHDFISKHILRGPWKDRLRPVLLNSWEASYFDITERKLLRLARKAKSVGIELLVMDDGWFGERNDDSCSLGDWYPNKKKLPGGLKGICDKVNKLGLKFGIWVEPEMINRKSRLYEAHPDWALEIKGKKHALGRNQMILDLTRKDVREYLIKTLSDVFSSADISYVKWDYNRNFTDVFSSALPKDRQGEVFHRYILGLYEVMRELTSRFPEILFEGCASGGNRFDLGILCFFPQIWGSDDTDALSRAEIQNGYSYGYPQSTFTCHVSDVPNHQTLRKTPLDTRFNVASFGNLGYECNLCEMKKRDVEDIRKQIEFYKEMRKTTLYGHFRRTASFSDGEEVSVLRDLPGNHVSWTIVSEDLKTAYSMTMQILVHPNTQINILYPKGLGNDILYKMSGRDLKYDIRLFGGLINHAVPIHVKQDSLIHALIAKFVFIKIESEEHTMYGDAMMNAGVHLRSSFAGCGFNDQMRYYPDFGSRIYTIKAVS
ncbi:MAG: alpha-galactosidase [Clostridiales bacterium]|nr:alpha-galactosidase [Clostridiales bacterium]